MSQTKEPVYKVYICKIHKKQIHYIDTEKVTGFYHCWDCSYEFHRKNKK